jgi:hypothetical protein
MLKTGEVIHVRCAIRDEVLQSAELSESAHQAADRAEAIVARSQEILDTLQRDRTCAVCRFPLVEGGRIVPRGERFVHAGCQPSTELKSA